MKLLLCNILLFCIVIVKASEGNHEDPKSDNGSSLLELIKKSKPASSRRPRAIITDTIFDLLRIKYGIVPSYMKDNSSWMNSVIVPVIHDFVNDEVASENVTRLVRGAIQTVLPLVTEILNAPDDPSNVTFVKIPRAIVESTYEKLRTEYLPFLNTIIDMKSGYFRFLVNNTPGLVAKSMLGMKPGSIGLFSKFFFRVRELYKQYADLYRSSTDDFVYIRPAIDIVTDINSLVSLLNEHSDVRENWRNNLLVLQNASGITSEALEEFLADIPGMGDVMDAMSFAFLFQVTMLFT